MRRTVRYGTHRCRCGAIVTNNALGRAAHERGPRHEEWWREEARRRIEFSRVRDQDRAFDEAIREDVRRSIPPGAYLAAGFDEAREISRRLAEKRAAAAPDVESSGPSPASPVS